MSQSSSEGKKTKLKSKSNKKKVVQTKKKTVAKKNNEGSENRSLRSQSLKKISK